MNILHLLSQNHLTGSEVYAAQLVKHQVSEQHQVFQISNGFFTDSKAQKKTLTVETRSKIQFVKNVFWLRQFLKKENIHVIHTHSRAAAKLAFWARCFLKIGMVSTIHGRQHPSLSKKLINQYGDFLVAVCETIQQQLMNDFKYNQRRIKVIRNPVSLLDFKYKNIFKTKGPFKIAVIGRTTGPKGERTQLVLNTLPHLLRKLGHEAEYFLIGGSEKHLDLSKLKDFKISEKSIPALNSDHYQEYDLVIGSGRVAIESLIAGVPTFSFGEAKYLGLVRLSNLDENYATNFGDMDSQSQSPRLYVEQLEHDIKAWLSFDLSPEIAQISKKIQNDFNAEKINKVLYRLYESSYFLRNYSSWIPVLMYHKIPLQELDSVHKIFVTKDDFKKHLQFYKKLGFQTLAFSDLKKYKSAEKNFKSFPKKPLILTFDDGYKDNLEHASPLLKEFGFKAQLFLLADSKIDSNQWDHSESEKPHEIVSGMDRLKWNESAFEIGSHGFSHQKITQMSEAEARLELRKSKQDLENEFKKNIPVYAFTYGDTSLEAAKWALEEGYDYAVNTDTGGQLLEEDPYRIFRVNIFPNESFFSLFKKTSSWYRTYYFRKRKK